MDIQLDLFEEINEMKILEERSRQIEKQVTNVRRGLFGRLNKVYKWMISIDEIIELQGKKISDLEKSMADKDKEISSLKQTIGWMESVA